MPGIFDTHAHYDDEAFSADRDSLLASLPENRIDMVMVPGCSLESSRAALALAEKYPFVWAACGIHPENASEVAEEQERQALGELENMTTHPKVRAVGEIGLDYHYSPDEAQKERQKRIFCLQMELAGRQHLPVLIHSRDAWQDTMEILGRYPEVKGVFHCFSGSAEGARELVKTGWMISLTGVLTFKNARKAIEVLRAIPLENFMLETDAPYMAPEPVRGTRNDSRNLWYVAKRAAEILEIDTEALVATTTENALRFFSLK